MGSKTQTATATSAPNPYAAQQYQMLLPQIAQVANTAMGQTVPTLGTAPVNAQQQAGIANINEYATSAVPTIDAATGLAYMSSQPITAADISQYESPYIQDVVNATEAQFQNQNAQQLAAVKGNAIAQGAMGGNREAVAESELANQQNLAQAPVIASLENQGFTTGLNTALTEQQMGQAGAYTLGNLGVAGEQAALSGAGAQIGAGTLEQQTQQAANLAAYQQAMGQLALPLEATQYEAGAMTGVGSQLGGTSTTTQPGPSVLGEVAGLGLGGIGILGGTGAFGSSGWLSDRRLKENIRRIGKLYDGQTIYRFNYKGDPATRIGLIAQDVEKHHPDAIHEVGGFKAVDYDEATRDAIRRASGGVANRAVGGNVNYPTFGGGYGSPKLPFGGGSSFIPNIGITHGRDIPAPPRIAEPTDPSKQMQGWANAVKDLKLGDTVSTDTKYAGAPVEGAAPDYIRAVDYMPSPGIAPASPGGIGSAFRGGAVRRYADGGAPMTPEDIDPASLPRGLVLPPEARAAGAILAPSLTSYLSSPRGDAPAPTVLPSGKISSADPRMGPVASDVAGLATLPLGLAGAAPEMAAARLAPAAAEAADPILKEQLAAHAARVAESRSMLPNFGVAGTGASMTPEATAAMRSALGRGRAYDIMAGVGGGGAGAMPSAAAAGPNDGPGTRPTAMPDELDRIADLNKQIAAINAQRAAAVAKATAAARGIGPLGVKVRQDTAAAPFDKQIGDLNETISTINKNITDRQALWDQHKAEYDLETAPFATRHPEQATALRGLPALSPIGGAVLGGLAGRTISPLKRLATYGAAGLGGALEGAIGAYYPTLADAGMPRGTQAKAEADINNPNPSFWINDIAPEAGFGAALGILGAKYGMLRRPAGVAPAVAGETAAAAKAWPKRLAPADMVQDAAGRWRLANPVGGYNRGAFIPKNLQPPGSALSASSRTANIIPAEANGGVVRGYQDGGAPPVNPFGGTTGADWAMGPPGSPGPYGGVGDFVPLMDTLPSRFYPGEPGTGNTSTKNQDRVARTPVSGVAPAVVDATDIPPLNADRLAIGRPSDLPTTVGVGGPSQGGVPPAPDASSPLVRTPPTAIPPRTVGEGAERRLTSPAAPPPQGEEPPAAPAAGVDWSANSKLWPALMAAGFGMMASRSPFAGVAIGEGGETGLQMYAGEKAQEMKQAQLDMEARKLDAEVKRQQDALDLERQKVQFEMGKPMPGGQGLLGPTYVTPDPEHPGQFRPIQISGQPGTPGMPGPEVVGQTDTGAAPSAGEEFLKTLAPREQAIVKGIAEGTLPNSAYLVTKNPQLMAAVQMYDPSFTYGSAPVRAAAQKAFGANGVEARNFQSNDMAIKHIGSGLENIEAMGNLSTAPSLNAPYNAVRRELSPQFQEANTKLGIDIDAISNELMRAFRGSGSASEKEAMEWRSKFPLNGSPVEQRAALREAAILLGSRISAAGDRFNDAVGPRFSRDPLSWLSPEGRNVLNFATTLNPQEPIPKNWRAAGASPQPAQGGEPAATTRPVPTEADIAYVKAHPEVRDRFIARFGVQP